MASNNNSNNIDITYATMGEVMDYQTSSPTSGFHGVVHRLRR